MKTAFYIVAIVAFSALMLTPKEPKMYPPKEVLEKRKEIAFKEKEINSIIKKIENNLAIDSIRIHHVNEQ
jgi:hypothetical protein